MTTTMTRAKGAVLPVVGGLLLALAGTAAWQLSALPAADAAPRVALVADEGESTEESTAYLLTCADEPTSEPVTYQLLCGLGLDAFDHLEWTDWGADEASAVGRYEEKICDPSCAAASIISYPVYVTAGDLEAQDGASSYRSLTVEFPGMRPGWAEEATQTFDLDELRETDVS
ncbi:hypothetical protein [Isoptericola croceus]|uniref:hypothetical protein n=1 Tax=Isoptericola croceus TaxID=3031406 RepID=UPI0023F83FE3|nr:hypothetical protein [Isoptericola croceus]